jgi:hypothetical protein
VRGEVPGVVEAQRPGLWIFLEGFLEFLGGGFVLAQLGQSHSEAMARAGLADLGVDRGQGGFVPFSQALAHLLSSLPEPSEL